MTTAGSLHIGCAGWTVPRAPDSAAPAPFPATGTHLQRYASRLPASEINSSFYRSHKPATYRRWAASVPDTFRFSAKIPKAITHERKLVDAMPLLEQFLTEVANLGEKLGCLLVQLPPSFAFDAGVAGPFFDDFRRRHTGAIALEPRHATWFTPDATALITAHQVARVAADPILVPGAGTPGGWMETRYYRLHGSPRTYYSAYPDAYLQQLAGALREARRDATAVWCIFDNTALGAAAWNALALLDLMSDAQRARANTMHDDNGSRAQ